MMGAMKNGPYGQYYEYTDDTGTIKRISVKSKYITEKDMEELVLGKKIQYTRQSLFGVETVEAYLSPYTTKHGKETTIIKTEVISSTDDRVTIKHNKNKFIVDNFMNKVAYKKYIESVLHSLSLSKDYVWKVYVACNYSELPEDQKTDNNLYSAMIIYRDYNGISGIENEEYQALSIYYKYEPDGNALQELEQTEYTNIVNKLKSEKEDFDHQMQLFLNECMKIRDELYNDASKNLEDLIKDIDFEQTLDLGHFQKLKTFLVRIKNKSNAIQRICYEAYKDTIYPIILKENLLYMLKVYYEFNNISDKNIKSIAKFVACNNIEEYYEDILNYDEAIETIIDFSKDKRLLKDVLTNIAGNASKVNFLQDKSFYFETVVRVRSDVILFNPVQLLDELKALIPLFNVGSQAAILTNIILNEDESFTYQFYTYSQSENGGDMDGRRVSYMTRLYNRSHKNKLYLEYSN